MQLYIELQRWNACIYEYACNSLSCLVLQNICVFWLLAGIDLLLMCVVLTCMPVSSLHIYSKRDCRFNVLLVFL